MSRITPIVMPKWGLSMKEGTVHAWLVDEGTEIKVGMPILEVETDKIANEVEAADPGVLRRRVASAGDLLPVKALLGVMAADDVSDADIDAFVAAWVTPAAEDRSEEAGPVFEFAEVDGVRIRYARRGASEGMPVLFVHGFGGDLDNWLFNIDAIGEAAPVIAVDLPGHGESDVKLPGASFSALAQFLGRFMDTLGVSRAHLVGHSMGGAIASHFAVDSPQRVASLTLIGSAGFGEEINRAYLDGFVEASSRRELKPALELLFADPALVSRQMIDDVLKYKRLDGVGDLLSRLRVALFDNGSQKEHPGLLLRGSDAAARLLVIWGRADRIIPVEHASRVPDGAAVEILDEVGHMAQMESASEVNRLILRHIAA